MRSRDALGHARRQFPVGQGGFHVGSLTFLPRDTQLSWCDNPAHHFANADFLYAYDCGSEPRRHVDREIVGVISARRSRQLDFLFLSHFDRDHICGVSKLLDPDNGLNIDTIVLPFVDDVERMISFGRMVDSYPAGHLGAFYRDLIVDPIPTLMRFGPRQIIFIDANGEEGRDDGEAIFPADPTGGSGDGFVWKVRSVRSARSHVRAWRPESEAPVEVMIDGEFIVTALSSGLAWRLKPYVRKAENRAKEDFSLCAELLLGWPPNSFRERMRNAATRRHVVLRHKYLLARVYRHAFKDKNLTSLCLYSGPLDPENSGAISVEPALPPAPETKVAWLGTGDAHLKDYDSIYEFERHFLDQLPYVSTFVLPHHGSIHNSAPDHLVSEAENWVVSTDPIHRKWKHPNPELVKAAKAKGTLQHVRSSVATGFSEHMLVF